MQHYRCSEKQSGEEVPYFILVVQSWGELSESENQGGGGLQKPLSSCIVSAAWLVLTP